MRSLAQRQGWRLLPPMAQIEEDHDESIEPIDSQEDGYQGIEHAYDDQVAHTPSAPLFRR